MARLIRSAALSLSAGVALWLLAGSASLAQDAAPEAAPSARRDCALDFRFDPPRMICRPRLTDRPGAIRGDAIGGAAPTPRNVPHWQDHGAQGEASPGRDRRRYRRPSATASEFSVLQPARALILPGEMPPKGVAAYGIVAFTTSPIAESRQRFLDVCAAYKSALIAQGDLGATPLAEQMVTFWPVTERAVARDEEAACDAMVDSYDLKAALDAIRDADQDKARYAERRGPFLIAWSPSESRAKADSVILVIDMSDIRSAASFQETFMSWRQKIIDDPKFWRDGFSVEQVRLILRDTLDRYGGVLLSFLPGKPEPPGKAKAEP